MKANGKDAFPDFSAFTSPLIGLQVSRVWQGYGSAIFLEFGNVQPRRRRDGSPRGSRGEWKLMIEWSWRIEGKRRIRCGSWSDGARWPRAFARMQGARVTSVSLFGRLPEISLSLSNRLHLLSMMTAEGDPVWALTPRSLQQRDLAQLFAHQGGNCFPMRVSRMRAWPPSSRDASTTIRKGSRFLGSFMKLPNARRPPRRAAAVCLRVSKEPVTARSSAS